MSFSEASLISYPSFCALTRTHVSVSSFPSDPIIKTFLSQPWGLAYLISPVYCKRPLIPLACSIHQSLLHPLKISQPHPNTRGRISSYGSKYPTNTPFLFTYKLNLQVQFGWMEDRRKRREIKKNRYDDDTATKCKEDIQPCLFQVASPQRLSICFRSSGLFVLPSRGWGSSLNVGD